MTVDFGSVQVLSPPMVGREGQTVNGYETGSCAFLKDGLCELHSKGLKPLEGRLAHHSMPWQIARDHVVSLWAGSPMRAV